MTVERQVVEERVREWPHCLRPASDSAMEVLRDPNGVFWRRNCFGFHPAPAGGGGVLAKTCFAERRYCRGEYCRERRSSRREWQSKQQCAPNWRASHNQVVKATVPNRQGMAFFLLSQLETFSIRSIKYCVSLSWTGPSSLVIQRRLEMTWKVGWISRILEVE